MNPKFKLSVAAAEDVVEIWNGVVDRTQSQRIADLLVFKFSESFDLIGEHPGAGHTREDLTSRPYRFWPVFQYLVIYDPRFLSHRNRRCDPRHKGRRQHPRRPMSR